MDNMKQAIIQALTAGQSAGGIPLGQINISKPRAEFTQSQSIPETVKPQGSKFNLGKVLTQLGIPLGAAIAGSVNSNFLPAASGLATGYQGQMDKIRQAEQDRLEKLEILAAQEDAKSKRPKKTTWKQDQKIKSIKHGLSSGKVVIGRDFGEPTTYEIKTLDDAYKAIMDAGLDPSLFSEELKKYGGGISNTPSAGGELINIEFNNGTVRQMTREEAIANGYVK